MANKADIAADIERAGRKLATDLRAVIRQARDIQDAYWANGIGAWKDDAANVGADGMLSRTTLTPEMMVELVNLAEQVTNFIENGQPVKGDYWQVTARLAQLGQ